MDEGCLINVNHQILSQVRNLKHVVRAQIELRVRFEHFHGHWLNGEVVVLFQAQSAPVKPQGKMVLVGEFDGHQLYNLVFHISLDLHLESESLALTFDFGVEFMVGIELRKLWDLRVLKNIDDGLGKDVRDIDVLVLVGYLPSIEGLIVIYQSDRHDDPLDHGRCWL